MKMMKQKADVEKVVVQESKKQSFFKTKTGAMTIALVGGIAIGSTFFSMSDADAESTEAATQEIAPAQAIGITTASPEPALGVPTTASEPAEAPSEPMMVKTDENGTSYSTDGGQTWIEGEPPGTTVTQTPDGNSVSTSSQGTPPEPGEEGGTLVRTSSDGTSEYSTDGGETWTEGLPPGAETVTNPDGSQGVMIAEPGVPTP